MNTKACSRPLLFFAVCVAFLLGGCRPVVESEPLQPRVTVAPTAATVAPTTTTPATTVPAATETPSPVATAAGDAGEAVAVTIVAPEESGEEVPDPMTLDEAGIAFTGTSPLLESVTVETALASERIPDHGPRFLLQPAHTVVYLLGYPESENHRKPQITIYPVEAYEQLNLVAEKESEHLRALLAAWPHPEPMPGEDRFPHLPERNAAQILHARAERVSFAGGEGIRYLTQYVQDYSPVVSNSIFYTFQGLTHDGRFYISAVLPVSSGSLPQDIPEAQSQGFDSFTYSFDRIGYEQYLAEQQVRINSLEDAAFMPDLALLDALVQSLDLTAYEGPAVEIWAPDVAPGPDQVLDDFLEAYIAAGGFRAGAHEDNLHLHPEFVAAAEETVETFRAQGIASDNYDPVLMTRLGAADLDLSELGLGFDRLIIGPASITGESASVLVERHWHYTLGVSPLRFSLTWNGDRWQIDGVSSNLAPEPTAPEQVAETLFAMMIASGGQFAGPAEFVRVVDPAIVAPNGTVDICSQAWPDGITVEGSFVQPSPLHLSSNVEEEASVVLYSLFPEQVLSVQLARQNDSWQVTGVICGDTPAGRARAFYSWYFGAAAQAGETRWAERAPQVDWLNPGHSFVTERFLREAMLRIQEDPYLPTAEVPDRFVVESTPAENEVLVHLEYLGEEQGAFETLRLRFAREGGPWLIDQIELATER